MATKKAASTKKATAKKPAAAKTTVHTVSASAKPSVPTKVAEVQTPRSTKAQLPDNIINIVLAELFGTFILTMVALATFQDAGALYVGLALAVIVVAVGAISGAHVNPAVTFGLWAARKLKTVLVPFYWGAQFLGAMLAVIVANLVANNSINLSFSDFATIDWGVFGAEMVAAAVFLFGLVGVISHRELSNGARALGVGLSLTAAIVIGGTLLSSLKAQDVVKYQQDYQSAQSADGENAKQPAIPHSAYVKGVTVNPAVALAVTDNAENKLDTNSNNSKTNSRLSLEVILGTLVGAAVGANLYLIIAGRKQN